MHISHAHVKLNHTFHSQLESGPPSLRPCWTTAFNYSQLLSSQACKTVLSPIYQWPWLSHSDSWPICLSRMQVLTKVVHRILSLILIFNQSRNSMLIFQFIIWFWVTKGVSLHALMLKQHISPLILSNTAALYPPCLKYLVLAAVSLRTILWKPSLL